MPLKNSLNEHVVDVDVRKTIRKCDETMFSDARIQSVRVPVVETFRATALRRTFANFFFVFVVKTPLGLSLTVYLYGCAATAKRKHVRRKKSETSAEKIEEATRRPGFIMPRISRVPWTSKHVNHKSMLDGPMSYKYEMAFNN